MTTEWIRKHINPSLVARYERELEKLRGETSHCVHMVENIKKMNEESERIKTDAERRAQDLAEDAEMERFFRNNK